MSVLPKIGGTILVVAIGAGVWAAGHLQGRHAAARRAFLMMRHDTATDEPEAIGIGQRFLPASWRDDLRTRRAESQYWLGQYELLRASVSEGSAGGPNASYLMLVANAGYREVTSTLTDATPIDRFDGIGRLYLDVLEQDPTRIDAAFNYEFVIRRRNALVRDRTARRKTGGTAAPSGTDAATSLLKIGESPADPQFDAAELAAWAMVASVILNTDEAITKG